MATGPLKVTTSEAPFYMTGTAEGSNPDPQAGLLLLLFLKERSALLRPTSPHSISRQRGYLNH